MDIISWRTEITDEGKYKLWIREIDNNGNPLEFSFGIWPDEKIAERQCLALQSEREKDKLKPSKWKGLLSNIYIAQSHQLRCSECSQKGKTMGEILKHSKIKKMS